MIEIAKQGKKKDYLKNQLQISKAQILILTFKIVITIVIINMKTNLILKQKQYL